MFGGLRPVEHTQQIFGYRNAFIYPDRIFLMNVWGQMKDGKVSDPTACELMQKQAKDFKSFVDTLGSSNLR